MLRQTFQGHRYLLILLVLLHLGKESFEKTMTWQSHYFQRPHVRLQLLMNIQVNMSWQSKRIFCWAYKIIITYLWSGYFRCMIVNLALQHYFGTYIAMDMTTKTIKII